MNCTFRESQQQSSVCKPAVHTSSVESKKTKKKKTAIISVTSLSSAGKCVISACLQVWHTCSSSFAVMFAFKKPGGRQPLSLAVTETRKKKRGREETETSRERGEVEKRAPLCVPFFQKSLTGLMPSLLCMWRNGHLHGYTIETTLLTQ